MMSPPVEKIVYCYGKFQEMLVDYPDVIFHEGLPDISQFDVQHRTLLILDDIMSKTNDSVSNIFTKVSHHRNVSVIHLTRNLCYKSKHSGTMSLNAHYIDLFKSPQVATISQGQYREYPSKCSLAQAQTKAEKKNKKDKF